MLGDAAWKLDAEDLKDDAYPMDFYANQSLGKWTPNHKPPDLGACEKLPGASCCGKCEKSEFPIEVKVTA